MADKERNQNLVIGDNVTLRFFVWNEVFADPHEMTQVDIYKLLDEEVTEDNPLGKRLVETVDAADIVKDDVGKYHIELALSGPLYTQGRYQDEWNIIFEDTYPASLSPMNFEVGPDKWFTDSQPLVHDFSFSYRPNRIVQGSKKYIEIKVTPDVPRGTDKQRYYENIAIGGTIYFSMEQKCGECLPQEQDLRIIVENEEVTNRDGCMAYYLLDTRELDCGLYDVWFTLEIGENIYVGDKQPLQIFH